MNIARRLDRLTIVTKPGGCRWEAGRCVRVEVVGDGSLDPPVPDLPAACPDCRRPRTHLIVRLLGVDASLIQGPRRNDAMTTVARRLARLAEVHRPPRRCACPDRSNVVRIRAGEPAPAIPARCPSCGLPRLRGYVLVDAAPDI